VMDVWGERGGDGGERKPAIEAKREAKREATKVRQAEKFGSDRRVERIRCTEPDRGRAAIMVCCMHSYTLQGVRALHGAALSLSFCRLLSVTLRHCRSYCMPHAPARQRQTGSPLPHLHQDWAHPCHTCAETGLTPATSAPGLGPPPHLRRDWARHLHESTECHGRKERVRFLQPHHAGPVPVQMWEAASKVPAQMWARRAQSRRRCGRGEPSYVASGRTSVTKRSTQHTPSAARTTASANGRGRPARTVASESPPGHTFAPGSFPCGGR
jgi:hypothetical protein